jgi:hypothetical protein
MSHQLTQQHPQVVLRSRYQQLKALLALAAITVLCLTAAVVILAVNEDGAEIAPVAAAPAVTAPVVTDTVTATPGLRFDGGPDEGSSGPQAVAPSAGTRPDGGPEEGTSGPQPEPIPMDAGRWGPH